MLLGLISALVLASQTPPQDAGVMSTAPGVDAGESQRFREAVAYANPLPRGPPRRTIRWWPGARRW